MGSRTHSSAGVSPIDFGYDYHAVFDYEALLLPVAPQVAKDGQRPPKVRKTTVHTPVSCSVNSNVPGYGVRFFCVTDFSNTYEMNKAIFDYFLQASEKACRLMKYKIRRIFGRSFDEVCACLREKKANRMADQLLAYVTSLPVLSFNGGNYDINLNKKHGMLSILAGLGITFSAKKANKYMSIGTTNIKMLDVTNYLPAGQSYEKYVKAYECKLGKGYFPYEWMDYIKKLDHTSLPPISAFYSKLKGGNSLGETAEEMKANYEMLQKTWQDNNMHTMKDFLRWYNNLDVIPFVEAVGKQKQFYLDMGLDMFKDAVSIPGLAEKIMFKKARQVAQTLPIKSEHSRISSEKLKVKITSYMEQDRKAERTWKDEDYLDVKTAYEVLDHANYRCHYCHRTVGDRERKITFDRIDCGLAHLKTNVVIACITCNTSRGDQDYNMFYYWTEMKRINLLSPQIKLISEKNKNVFYKLKENVVGGPSIIFHRYHEAGKTKIKHPTYDLENKTWEAKDGKLVEKIVGFDANALYLWALSQPMPCGELKEIDVNDSIITKIQDNRLFGFAEVDIETPESLYNKFSEFPPIFKNMVIEDHHLGAYMKDLRREKDKKLGDNRKLVSLYGAKKILLYTPLLKWYLEHGLIVTKVHSFIKATPNNLFKSFTETVSDNRRNGDKDVSKAMIAEAWKLTGNSAFGRTGMNKNRHTNTKYVDDIYKAKRKVNNWLFRDLNEIESTDGSIVFEVSCGKKQIKQNCPLQVASAVYQLAKLRMLQFYHDFLDRFVSRDDFQMVEMDTDSAYMGIAGKSIEALIKPEMKQAYEDEKYQWFPDNRTPESKAYTKRTPGLFKVEWEGDGIVALTSKMYYCHRADGYCKSSAKGIQANKNTDILTFEKYKDCLMKNEIIQAHNRGFRTWDGTMMTYEQIKDGLSPIYDKRVVMDDGITTYPIVERASPPARAN